MRENEWAAARAAEQLSSAVRQQHVRATLAMLPSRDAKIADAFLVVGAQYFATARHVALEFIMPVSGTLYHSAIEMLLKGCLVDTLTVPRLKAIGHDLNILWCLWKATPEGSALGRFDQAVAELHRFERIRYPDKIVDEGSAIGISLGGPGPSLVDALAPGAPKYKLNIEQLDNLVLAMFRDASIPLAPYFACLPGILRKGLPAAFTDDG